jgi:energy-coupling factor transport system ATP-binding protein
MEETINADRVIIMDKGSAAFDGTPAKVFRRADEIDALGLKLPFVIELADKLRKRGMDVPDGLLTQEALANYLKEAAV